MDSENDGLAKSSNSQKLISLLTLDFLGKISAIFVGIIYLCGFLTLNSHLYKYGNVELGIASTEYFISGAVFVLYLTVYGVFAGRAIILSKKWLNQHIEQLKEKNAPPVAFYIAFAHMLIELIFFHCLSSALFSTFAFEQIESAGFYFSLSLVFIISYGLDIFNWDVRHPFCHLIIDGILKVLAIFSFYYLSVGGNIYTVFWAFLGYSMYINFVLDSFERYTITNDRIIFNLGYTAIFVLLSAITFGTSVYGEVSRKIGGGKAIEMTIGINDNRLKNYPDKIESPIVGEVVYSTANNIYIKRQEHTLVLPRSSVTWMDFHQNNSNKVFDLLEQMIGIKEDSVEEKEPNKSNHQTN